MEASFAAAWHLDLAVFGLLAGLAAVALDRVLPVAPERLAGAAAALVLAIVDVAPWGLAVVAAGTVAVGSTAAPRLAVVATDVALGLAAVVLVAPDLPVGATVVVAGAAATTVAAGWSTDRTRRSVTTVLALAGAVAVWASAPDTEAALVAAAVLIPVAAVRVIPWPGRPGPPPGGRADDLVTAGLVTWWAAGWGFAGRPAGLAALPAIVIATCGWAIVAQWGRPQALTARPSVLSVGGAGVVAIVAARSAGLRSSIESPPWTAMVLGAAGLAIWVALTVWSRRAASGPAHEVQRRAR